MGLERVGREWCLGMGRRITLRWPDADSLSRRKGLTVGDLRQAVVAENAGWRREQVGVLLSSNGWLRELRLCYGRDFMPSDCPRREGHREVP